MIVLSAHNVNLSTLLTLLGQAIDFKGVILKSVFLTSDSQVVVP